MLHDEDMGAGRRGRRPCDLGSGSTGRRMVGRALSLRGIEGHAL